MSEDSRELVITLDFRKLFALSLLTVITLVSLYTYIGALLAWDAPTEEISVNVDGFDTLDNYGGPVFPRQYNKGDLFDLRIYAETAEQYWLPPSYENFVGNITFRVIVTIFDPSDAPILCESCTCSLENNTAQWYYLEKDMRGSFYQIPSDAVASAGYKIRVLFWSDWLPGGVAKAVQAYEASFEVL